MEYWIRLDGEQIGPLTCEEVRRMSLRPDTPVWVEGLEDWTIACCMPSLADLFRSPGNGVDGVVPPPMPGGYNPANLSRPGGNVAPVYPHRQIDLTGCPDNYMGMSIAALVVLTACCGILGLVGLVPLLNSMKVQTLFLSGEHDRAAECAAKAKNWSIACYVIAFILMVLGFVIMSFVGAEILGVGAAAPAFLGL